MKPSISIMDEVNAFGLSLNEVMSIKGNSDEPTIIGEVHLLEPKNSRIIMANDAFCSLAGIKSCKNRPYSDFFHEDDIRHYLFLYRSYLYQLKGSDPSYASFSKLVRIKTAYGNYKTVVLSQRGAIYPEEGIYRYRGIFHEACIPEYETPTELYLETLNSLGELVQALMLKMYTVSSLCNNISEKNCLSVSCENIRTIFDKKKGGAEIRNFD
jgi:PAS domain-containing protein